MTAPAQRPGYFDALYAQSPDPWGFETRAYEQDKYAATLAALPRVRFASALEVGCSIGVLTQRLADRCDALLAIDIVQAALDRAQMRCTALGNVTFAQSHLPEHAPSGPFDLIILSEVLYYFDRTQMAQLIAALLAETTGGAIFVLVHWLGPTPDYPLTGDEAVSAFEAASDEWVVIERERTPDYRIDVLGRIQTV